MDRTCVVIGLHENGLGVARALGRQRVPVIAVDRNVRSPYAATRYAEPVLCYDIGGRGLIETLCEIGEQLVEPGVLIPTLDRAVLQVSEHRARLERFYSHSLPDESVVSRLMNKAEMAAYARSQGFIIPETHNIRSEEELESSIGRIQFPCILKPQAKNVAFVQNTTAKAFRIRSADELRGIYRTVAEWEPEVVVQEWIAGPDSNLIFCLYYFDRTGDPIAWFTGRKLRQFIPYCGTACSAEPWDDPIARDAGIQFFQRLGYRGFGAIEFKRDPNGDYYLIEPTVGRTEHLFALAAANGVNLPYIGYCDMAGLPCPGGVPAARPVRYLDWRRDFRAARAYYRAGELTVGQWLDSLRGRKQYALFAWDDRRPFLSQVKRRLLAKPRGAVRRTRAACQSVAAAVHERIAPGRPHRSFLKQATPANTVCVRAALDWLCAAQDAARSGGVARGYTLVEERGSPAGWQPPYAETTGYIIPTFFDCAHYFQRDDLRRRAIAMADWCLDIQLPDGGIPGGIVGRRQPPVVFNTAMVLLGWCRAFQETGEPIYRTAMQRAGDFLAAAQDADGAWRRCTNVRGELRVHAYDVRSAWPLLLAYECLGDDRMRQAAVNNLEFTLGLQRPNGWFESNALHPSKNAHPLTHTIAYATDGLLEAGLLLDEPRYIAAAKTTADALRDALEADGYLAGQFDAAWKPAASWCCLTGNLQLAAIWLKFYQLTGEPRYLQVARQANRFVKCQQNVASGERHLRGGLAGSYPVSGAYGRNQLLNWVAKFFIDALLLEEIAVRRGPSTLRTGVVGRAASALF